MSEKSPYVAVPLAQIDPDQQLVSAIYLKINDKFIKYKEQGDILSAEKYDLFLSKNVREIYLHEDEFKSFIDWVSKKKEARIEGMVERVGAENRELVEKRESIKEMVFETFASEELDEENVELLMGQVKKFVELASKEKIPQTVIAKLAKHSPSLADHSVDVAMIAVYVAMVLGHSSAITLETIYLGALFHDYGKAKVPVHILENPQSPLYLQAMNQHSLEGSKLIRKIKKIPQQVLMIVEQHHEQFNGQGFPRGLKGDEIYDLSVIVAIANYFDNAVMENIKKPSEMYKIACKAIEYDRGVNFDPKILGRVIAGFNLAYVKKKA